DGLRDSADLTQEEIDAIADSTEALHDASEAARQLEEILSRYDLIGFHSLVAELRNVKQKLKDATSVEDVERLQRAFVNLRQEGLEHIAGSAQLAIRSMQSMVEEGSSAYRAMEIAHSALNVVMAIGAVLNQGKGDPYTALSRVPAMAAAVAQLGVTITGSFGGASGAAEQRANQGTGSVLGDADAKSESIARATEITANATRELVG